jgi:hypothetical protein
VPLRSDQAITFYFTALFVCGAGGIYIISADRIFRLSLWVTVLWHGRGNWQRIISHAYDADEKNICSMDSMIRRLDLAIEIYFSHVFAPKNRRSCLVISIYVYLRIYSICATNFHEPGPSSHVFINKI